MSARRDGQQNDEAFKTKPKTDFMLKIITATPASATTTAATTLTTVKAQNKCATAATTTFSYQRAAKRCARFEQQATLIAATAATTTIAAAAAAELNTKENKIATATATATTAAQERQRCLAEQKAQLRAAFFKDFNALTAQQQQTREQHRSPQQRSELTKALNSTKRIQQLIEKFEAMIVQQPTEMQPQTQSHHQQQQQQQQQQAQLQKPALASSTANSDEGCNAGCGLSPCSSDNECCDAMASIRRKPKVTRCASSDSALGLEVDDVNMEVLAPPQRRMTLTVTDLPLRPALLPLAEPTALPDSPLPSPTSTTAGGAATIGVPSKVLLEERVVAALSAPPSSRRESTQSCMSDMGGMGGVRYVRTPSVVVSDYSDDITACGISMEEMEYFRLQRSRCQRRCSLEASAATAGGIGNAKDEAQSDVSAASSCSNLYYCGSTISALDGGECIVNGVRVVLNRKSSHSSSGELSDGDVDEDEEEELQQEMVIEREQQQQQQQLLQQQQQQQIQQQQQLQQQQQQQLEHERQLSELLAATQLNEGTKKVGSDVNKSDSSSASVRSSRNSDGNNGNVTFIGNLN